MRTIVYDLDKLAKDLQELGRACELTGNSTLCGHLLNHQRTVEDIKKELEAGDNCNSGRAAFINRLLFSLTVLYRFMPEEAAAKVVTRIGEAWCVEIKDLKRQLGLHPHSVQAFWDKALNINKVVANQAMAIVDASVNPPQTMKFSAWDHVHIVIEPGNTVERLVFRVSACEPSND